MTTGPPSGRSTGSPTTAHLATRGERDFSSRRGISAARYDLIAREGGAERARAALEQAGLLPADAR